MARHKSTEPLETIWNTPDELWDGVIVPVLRELDPEPRTGRPRIEQRDALDGVIYQMRSGCQWNQLPTCFGDDSSVHRTFQRWIRRGVLERIWARLVEACDELGTVQWTWQSADASMGKARFGGIKLDRTQPTGRSQEPKRASLSKAMAESWQRSLPAPMCMIA